MAAGSSTIKYVVLNTKWGLAFIMDEMGEVEIPYLENQEAPKGLQPVKHPIQCADWPRWARLLAGPYAMYKLEIVV